MPSPLGNALDRVSPLPKERLFLKIIILFLIFMTHLSYFSFACKVWMTHKDNGIHSTVPTPSIEENYAKTSKVQRFPARRS